MGRALVGASARRQKEKLAKLADRLAQSVRGGGTPVSAAPDRAHESAAHTAPVLSITEEVEEGLEQAGTARSKLRS